MQHAHWLVIGPQLEPDFLKKLSRFQKTHAFLAVDQGVFFLWNHHIKPTFAIGDWDSLEHALKTHASAPHTCSLNANQTIAPRPIAPYSVATYLKNTPHKSLPAQKDRSDLGAALTWLSKRKPHSVTFLGFQGGRIDHMLCALFEIRSFLKKTHSLKQVESCGRDGHWFFLSETMPLWESSLPKNTLCSLLTLSDRAQFHTQGLKWNLNKEFLKNPSQGLSNLTQETQIKIHLLKGQALVLFPHALALPLCWKER